MLFEDVHQGALVDAELREDWESKSFPDIVSAWCELCGEIVRLQCLLAAVLVTRPRHYQQGFESPVVHLKCKVPSIEEHVPNTSQSLSFPNGELLCSK